MGLFDKFKRAVTEATDPKKESAPVAMPKFSNDSQDDIVPIENRLKNQTPACNGLYPHEVLVLSYGPTCYKGKTDFPGFWWYQYGIKDVTGILESLEQRGYLMTGTVADAINLEKLPAIKEELSKRGLKTSGKKADLISRLIENADESELAAVFSKRPFALTENGEAALKEFEWIPYIHKHAAENLDIWNLSDMVLASSTKNYRDVIWGYLNKRSMDHIKNGNLGLYRNCRFEMSEFVTDEGKLQTAFPLLCEVIAYDLIGAPNSFRKQDLKMHLSYLFPYESSLATVPPEIVFRVKKLSESFGWSDQELHDQIQMEIEKLTLPFKVFTPTECADIVLAELCSDKAALESIYSNAKKRLK